MLSARSFRVLFAVTGALMLAPRRHRAAQVLRGEASVTTSGGYGRIVIRTSAEIESQVR